MRLLVIIATLLALASTARAEDPLFGEGRARMVSETAEWLRSTDPAKRAWAAYRVGQHRLHENIPLLVDALRSEADQAARMPRLALRTAILDALLRTDANVSSEDLAPHLVDLAAPAVVILLARNPAAHRELLSAIFEHPEMHAARVWLVAGNLLSLESRPGFVAGLLGRLSMRMEVRVREGDGPYRDPAGVVTAGHGSTPRPEGYPPLVVWEPGDPPPEDWPSYLRPRPGFLLVADGPRPQYAERVEEETRLCHTEEQDLPVPDICIAEWIALRLRDLGATPAKNGIRRHRWWRQGPIRGLADVGPPARPVIQARHAGVPPLLRQTTMEHASLEESYWEAVRTLLAAGLLTREEAAELSPKIGFVYVDKRWDTRIPLPEAPRSTARNPWRKRAPAGCKSRIR